MRPSPWLAVAALLLAADAGQAQFYGGYRQRQAVAVRVQTGPFTGFTYVAQSYGFGVPPGYWPGWTLGPTGLVPNVPVGPAPVVIQNVVQAPPAAAPVARGPAVPPPEFEAPPPPPGKAPPKAPGRPNAKAPEPPALVPAPPKVGNAPGRLDADRATDAGRKAFADGQYGRAAELFRRAADITPNEPSAHFLVSQALFALGKYREAVAAVGAGLALRADWPEARFNVRELYGKRPDLFDDHLKALRQAVEQFPEDPTLLFLLGHQLWFDGKAAEAKPLLLKARALDKGQTPAGAFAVK